MFCQRDASLWDTIDRDGQIENFEEQRSIPAAENSQPVRIDASLLSRYREVLGSIGRQPQGGILRSVYSPAWVQAREQLVGWVRAADLEVCGDAVGNLFGRLRGRDDSKTILTGSRCDTVPFGGLFDGALGILAGLVALRALREQAGQPHRSLEVVALCEEEGSRWLARQARWRPFVICCVNARDIGCGGWLEEMEQHGEPEL